MEGLIADIGGTNARFALARTSHGKVAISDPIRLKTADYPTVEAAIAAYLEQAGEQAPARGILAVAGPVQDNTIRFTNNPWTFSGPGVASALHMQDVRLFNDYTAQAFSLPYLQPDDVMQIGGDAAAATDVPYAATVLGPGTGFGASVLLGTGAHAQALAAEAGHAALPTTTEEDRALAAFLEAKAGRVTIEHILSGPGLNAIHEFLAAQQGVSTTDLPPEEITRRAVSDECSLCAKTVSLFCGVLGAVAGDLALIYGARTGVYIAGGIVPELKDLIVNSPFRERFEDKARFSSYTAAIPAYVITRPDPALLGAAALLARDDLLAEGL